MIQLQKKEDCCGCSACARRCPKHCITMKSDNEGFLYPHIDTAACNNCGLCEKICPMAKPMEPQKPLQTFAACNNNEEIRSKSSSGGVFTLLAEKTITEGGVVFGVKFDEEWMPRFDYSETIEGIAPFRGSKYVQAITGEAFTQAEKFLKEGRKVLFSGIPCHIAALKGFLRKDYDNLITMDIICHGVPSPKIWKQYLLQKSDKREITDINFRDKSTGWKRYSISIYMQEGEKAIKTSELFHSNSYMKIFLNDVILRPTCYQCPFKNNRSNSDITIGDCWGIDRHNPQADDDKGMCAVLINSSKGKDFYPTHGIKNIEYGFEQIIDGNPAYEHSPKVHRNRNRFFRETEKNKNLEEAIEKALRPKLRRLIKRKIKKLSKTCLNYILHPIKNIRKTTIHK